MPVYFNVNAILSGHLDYYCLLCEDLFKGKEDVCQHVATEQHKNRLEKTEYLKNYPGHGIKKLKKFYYCEFCNEVLKTSFKLRSHIETPTHIYLQESKQWFYTTSPLNLSWSGDDVMVSQFLVSEMAWRGILNDGTCLICDEEVESLDEHKKYWGHVVKMMQKKIIVGKDSLIREIDDILYQCLVCNVVCDDLDEHNSCLIHIMMFKKLQGNCSEIDENKEKSSENASAVEAFDQEASATGQTAAKDEDPQEKTPDSASSLPETAQTFAKANNISYDGFCGTCKVKVPFHLRNMKEHVNGYMHRLNKSYEKEAANEKAKNEKPSGSKDEAKKGNDEKPYKTKPFSDFTEHMNQRISMHSETRDFLINDEIYMEMLPMLMITRAGNQLVCQICATTLPLSGTAVSKHLHTKAVVNGVKKNHENLMAKVPVVTEFKRELIREVRPNVFHCGYCNIVVTGWDNINRHLNTTEHNRQKIEAGWKAEQFKHQAVHQQDQAVRIMQTLAFGVLAGALD